MKYKNFAVKELGNGNSMYFLEGEWKPILTFNFSWRDILRWRKILAEISLNLDSDNRQAKFLVTYLISEIDSMISNNGP